MPKIKPSSFAIMVAAVSGSLALAACGSPENAPASSATADPAVAEPAPALAPPFTGEWASLAPLIGQYPSQSGLFDTSVVAAPLKTLLGSKYEAFKTNMKVESPLTREGNVLYTSGNKPHEGGSNAAYLLIDPATKTMEAGLWENGKLTTYPAGGTGSTKPKDIQTLLSNSSS
ncbi:hypothetical protein [Brevundimonas sp.]|uniref:hypothetical protein n=1 Tax=Brevundimonas sp. TaxID=1871086 RepID=UPI002FCAAD69